MLEFPYDWRLSVEHNAKLLARAVDQHLEQWRRHRKGSKSAQVVLVAHSMGGLVARYFTEVLGGSAEVRAVATLGTPFYGAVKAAHLLSTGQGAPWLPRKRLRELATTLPGLHDLLPSYRCVDEGDQSRRLTPSDVSALGGNAELAEEAFVRRERLLGSRESQSWRGLWPLVGVEQETMQSLVLRNGAAEAKYYTLEPSDSGLKRVDRRGDGTVYRAAACLAGAQPLHLPQTHGALAARAEGITHARAVLTGHEQGPYLAGIIELGLHVPDVVSINEPFVIRVSGCNDPKAVECRVSEAGTGHVLKRPLLAHEDECLMAAVQLVKPGLYRIAAKAGGLSAVTELVLAVTPEDAIEE
ncbi:esterase/lipase family protein [Streptomyces massasporeus]